MAPRKRAPPERQSAQLTPEEMQAAIPKLTRRIGDLEAFDPETVEDRSDPKLEALEASIDRTLASIFGTETTDYQRYRAATNLDTASINMMYPTPIPEVRDGLRRGVARAVALLGEARTGFQEELEDLGEFSTAILRGRTTTRKDFRCAWS